MMWVIILVLGLQVGPRHAVFEGIKYPDQKTCMTRLNGYAEELKDDETGMGLCVPITSSMMQAIGKGTQL